MPGNATKIVALLSSAWLVSCSVFGVRETPEPPYRVLARIGTLQVRQYGVRIAADTIVPGDEIAARNIGFRRLASYIFGANHASARIAMTAPVAQRAVAQRAVGQQIDMTAPVAQAAEPAGWRIRFFMPAGSTMQSLPQPNDADVHLTEVPPETYAVRRFSGVPSTSAVAHESAALLRALNHSEWRPIRAPVAWFYDPPWTLPPLRRNEVAVVVTHRDQHEATTGSAG